MTVMKGLVITLAMLFGFAVGIGAQRAAAGMSMKGTVMDANTVREAVEYWELRGETGASVVITGRTDLPIIKWLREAKGRTVVLSLDAAP